MEKIGLHIALAVEVPLVALAVSIVALRVYSRLAIKRRLAPDDCLIVLATVAAVARTAISCMSAADIGGYDRKGPDVAAEVPFYRHVFERRIAYIVAVTFTRFAVLAYYLRIFPPGLSSLRQCTYFLMLLAILHFVEVLTVLVVFCKDIGQLWTSDWRNFTGSQCFSSAVYSYSAAIGDSIVDSLIFALPIPYVWQLSKLRRRQRLGLVLVFGLGFIACVVALLQIPFIKRRERNMRYFGSAVNMLIAIQISFAIIAASLPDLRALITRNLAKVPRLHQRRLRASQDHPLSGSGMGGAPPHSSDAESSNVGILRVPRILHDRHKVFRTPDWMRPSLPASLMSTRATQTDLTRVLSEDVQPQRLPDFTASPSV